MRKNPFCLSLWLLFTIIGGLGLTASDYVVCKDLFPDEFLDLALAPISPILSVFAPSRNTHPFIYSSLKVFFFKQISLLTTWMRC
ncbi:MAG: hypothetical protein A2V86_11680 [Deltaproteobacteria bacterium RBG_16_49_23]|nr:MAG: hypothetical protein A2V86_11680 [Deltaproteobacteria bacterium RBG_16_49_23]